MFHVAYLALIAWALHGVGVCCDDFIEIVHRTRDPALEDWQATPLLIATHGLAYGWIGFKNFFLYDALKIGWVALAYACAWRFGTLFFPPARAALFAALFLLYPSHDSTVFWYSNQYLTLTSGFYLLAFWLAERGRPVAATVASALGSFVSYGSPPWAFGLALVFLLRRKFAQALALLAPQILYIAYYVILTEKLSSGSRRLPSAWDPVALAKQFTLQLLGGLDAVIGPSLVVKIWASVASLTLVSAVVAAAIVLLIARVKDEPSPQRIPPAAWIGVLAVALGGFGMFAVTGGYPQSAFGMGNRATVYASFAVAFALAAVRWSPFGHAAIAAVLVSAALGVSDHWRAWRATQDETIAAIRSHPELSAGEIKTDTLFVSGRDYSRLGPIGHIAFFTEAWITDPVFALALGPKKAFRAVPLNSRFRVTATALLDSKHNIAYPVGETVFVYDAEANVLRRVARRELAPLLERLRPPPRHWIHLVDAPWLRDLILRWMPQLGYLFT